MTRKTPLLCVMLLAALAASPTAAEPIHTHLQGEALETAFDTLHLSNGEREEAKAIVQQFREDRQRAIITMRAMGESLPPQEEVTAVRTYSEADLEDRLADLLSDAELSTLMSTLQEQRERQNRQQANR